MTNLVGKATRSANSPILVGHILLLLTGRLSPLPIRPDLLSQVDRTLWHNRPHTLKLWFSLYVHLLHVGRMQTNGELFLSGVQKGKLTLRFGCV